MKETKKQIVAQTINKVSAQYSAKLKTVQKQNEELKSKCSALYSENKSLKENLAEANKKFTNMKIGFKDYKILWICQNLLDKNM